MVSTGDDVDQKSHPTCYMPSNDPEWSIFQSSRWYPQLSSWDWSDLPMWDICSGLMQTLSLPFVPLKSRLPLLLSPRSICFIFFLIPQTIPLQSSQSGTAGSFMLWLKMCCWKCVYPTQNEVTLLGFGQLKSWLSTGDCSLLPTPFVSL